MDEETEDRDELYREVCHNLMDLAVTVGLMNVGAIPAMPEDAQLGWNERLREINLWCNQQIEEAQSFGEAYDERGG